MFQSLGNLLSLENRAVQILIGAVVVAVFLGILLVLYRLIFAHRLRVPGSARGRAPRLGVVDVYSLDAQRQLVIVRRDNVEHLLMIGGPNDLVVEPFIVRAGAGVAGRDPIKQPTPPEPRAEPPAPARNPAPPPAPARRSPSRADPAPVAAAEPTPFAIQPQTRTPPARSEPVTSAKAPEPAPPEPSPAPELRAAPESASFRRPTPLTKPLARPNLPAPIAPLRPRNPDPAPTLDPSRSVEAKPEEASRAPEVAISPSTPPASAPAVIVVPPPPAVVVPPAASEKPRARGEDTFYDLESLEAEMARLLGRDG